MHKSPPLVLTIILPALLSVAATPTSAQTSSPVNPKLYGSVFGQWNNDDDEVLFNFRLTWIPKPGAILYFVFNQFGDTLDPRGWRMNKTVAMVKFVWHFSTK